MLERPQRQCPGDPTDAGEHHTGADCNGQRSQYGPISVPNTAAAKTEPVTSVEQLASDRTGDVAPQLRRLAAALVVA
jgi:hypothetical protein